MPVTIVNNGDGTGTFMFEIALDLTRLNLIAENWAEYVFDHGYGDHGTMEAPRDFADQSNAEKFAMINDHVIDFARAEAQTNYVNSKQHEARETAQVYADINLVFE